MLHTTGQIIDGDDMHWTVNCPKCDRQFEYTGFFDHSDVTDCRCGCEFMTDRIYSEDDKTYIGKPEQ